MTHGRYDIEEQRPMLSLDSPDGSDDGLVPVSLQPKSRRRSLLPRNLFKFSRVHALLSILISVGSLTLVMLTVMSHGERFAWRTTGFSIHGSPSPDVLDDLITIPTFKLNDPNEPFNYRWYTQAKLRWLTACLIRGNCPRNADKVIIVNTFHCQWALDDGYRGGEGVWCLGMIESWERQGFTVLRGGDVDWPWVYNIYRQIPNLVRVIIADYGEEGNRHGTFDQYKKTEQRPDGIPAWKYFGFSYYPTGGSTLVGPAWMVTAETAMGPMGNVTIDRAGTAWLTIDEEDLNIQTEKDHCRYTYLGYPLDPSPEDTVVSPVDERPNRVWILAKEAHYFHNGHQRVYELDFFERAHNELKHEFPGFEFVGGFLDHRGEEDREKYPLPEVVRNLGRLNATEFDNEFAKARLMLGLGAPTLSPSPYRALSKAVPFANPHTLRDDGHNEDTGSWSFIQHDSMQRVPEPYVYQVQAFNYTAFVDTIRRALSTPIPPFRFERMKSDVADRRLADFVLADWKGEAERILEARLAGSETQSGGDHEPFVL